MHGVLGNFLMFYILLNSEMFFVHNKPLSRSNKNYKKIYVLRRETYAKCIQ